MKRYASNPKQKETVLNNLCRSLLIAATVAMCMFIGTDAVTAQTELKIGTRQAPPFSMKSSEGEWTGISIDLLRELSRDLDFDYELVEVGLNEMVSDVADGKLDASIAAMTITGARESLIDFSHPFFRTGLGVAVSAHHSNGFSTLFAALMSKDILSSLGLLLGLLFVVGGLAWLAEHRKNPEEFEPKLLPGMFSGIWWAAVTMTTVGYGDKTPVTFPGRILGMAWMFSALILTAVIIAQLSAGLTAASIQGTVSGIGDLAHVRVGSVSAASSEKNLRELGVRPKLYPSVEVGLSALAAGKIDAFVHDQAILNWSSQSVPGIRMTNLQFAPQDYGIVLPSSHPRREVINLSLLSILDSDRWPLIVRQYLSD